jgi:molecular chaperone DnaJ
LNSMHRKDYYGILGLSRNADDREIRSAYRRLALQNHPDTNRDNPLAEERFKEITQAYEILSHRDKRVQYDLGLDPLAGGAPFPPPPFDPWSDPFDAGFLSGQRCRGGGFGRAFGRRMRTARRAEKPPAGIVPDLSGTSIHDLPLTSDEALKGTDRELRLHTGPDTRVLTVSIPAGVESGTLFRFKQPGGDIELLFRVRIVES